DVGRDDELMVFSAKLICHNPRVASLILERAGSFVADREGLGSCPGLLRHDRHEGAGVDTAGQKRSQRNLAHQVALDTASELGEKLLSPFRGRYAAIALVSNAPVAVLHKLVILVDEVVCWRQLDCVSKDS